MLSIGKQTGAAKRVRGGVCLVVVSRVYETKKSFRGETFLGGGVVRRCLVALLLGIGGACLNRKLLHFLRVRYIILHSRHCPRPYLSRPDDVQRHCRWGEVGGGGTLHPPHLPLQLRYSDCLLRCPPYSTSQVLASLASIRCKVPPVQRWRGTFPR